MTCYITHEANATLFNHCVPIVESCVNSQCVPADPSVLWFYWVLILIAVLGLFAAVGLFFVMWLIGVFEKKKKVKKEIKNFLIKFKRIMIGVIVMIVMCSPFGIQIIGKFKSGLRRKYV